MIKLMLDANICIYILKQQPRSILEHLEDYAVGELAVSMVVHGELVYGAYKSAKKMKNLANIESLMNTLTILPVDENVVHYYGEIRAELERRGQMIGSNDFWTAAHALSLQLPLATNNTREFIKVPNLEVVNWI